VAIGELHKEIMRRRKKKRKWSRTDSPSI